MVQLRLKRIIAFILSVCFMMQCTFPVAGTQNNSSEEDIKGTINILTGYASSKTSWPAILHRMKDGSGLIMLKAEDIATITEYDFATADDHILFANGSYEVLIDIEDLTAEVILNLGTERKFTLYDGKFGISDVVEWENKDGTTDIYLPVEEIFYLLNVSWVPENDYVATTTPSDTLFTIIGDYQEMLDELPSYGAIVGETPAEIWSNAFKYTTLALLDEIDFRLLCSDIVIEDKITEALLEFNTPAGQCLEENECQLLGAYIEDYYTPLDETIKLVDNYMKLGEKLGGDFNEETKNILQLFTGVEFSDLKLNVGELTELVSIVLDGIKIYEVVTRHNDWSNGYINQLNYLSKINSNSDIADDVKDAAKTLYNEHASEYTTILREELPWGVKKFVDAYLVVKKSKFLLVKLAYEITLYTAKEVSPHFEEALHTGDYAFKAKNDYNIATLVSHEYYKEIENLLKNDITMEDLSRVRTVGSLMTNASAHSWKNLYYLQRNEDEDTTEALNSTQYNCVYTTRFNESEIYDSRLILDNNYSNLYTMTMDEYYDGNFPEEGTVRVKIPEEYVHIDVYYRFIRDELLPELGYANLETTYKTVNAEDTYNNSTLYLWDKRKGLVGADITDLNSDGVDDLLVYYYSYNEALCVDLYTISDDEEIILINTIDIGSAGIDVNYSYNQIGLMNINDQIFIYAEDVCNAYFADGRCITHTWYGYDGDELRPYWRITQTDGGTCDMAYSLLTYSNSSNYTKQVLWADSGYMRLNPGITPLTTGTIGEGIEKGFSLIGLGYSEKEYRSNAEFSAYISYDSELFPSYWNTNYVKKSIAYLCQGSGNYSPRYMEISLTDETDLQKHIEELED